MESRWFTKRLHELAGRAADDVLRGIQLDLLENSMRGAVVRGLGGIRKARTANPLRGKGKRGGFRYLYLFVEHRSHIHLLFLLSKNEQEDLSSTEREALRKLVDAIRAH